MDEQDPQVMKMELPSGLQLPLLEKLPGLARKVVVLVVGSTIVLLGVILIFLPGPAFLVIPLGIAVLAGEYVWAKRWLGRIQQMVGSIKDLTKRASKDAKEIHSEDKLR